MSPSEDTVVINWFRKSNLSGFSLQCFMSSLLTPMWNNSVEILHQVATQHPQQEGMMVFCQRLLYTLQVGPQPRLFLCFARATHIFPLSCSVIYPSLVAQFWPLLQYDGTVGHFSCGSQRSVVSVYLVTEGSLV